MFQTKKNRILVTCAKGITPFLREELIQLGFPILSETQAGITTEGTIDDTLRLNLHLRTGHRVLFLIRDFFARDADALYRSMSEMPWEKYIAEDGYVCVTSSVDNPTIKTSLFANVKSKDAIVDRIKQKCRQRPDSGPDKDKTVINLYWKDNACSVYLDTSGEPLSKRGYRKIPMTAPMQETLASAIVIASVWDKKSNFINPMCGSGTLAIEAALIGLNKAPGLIRDNYGFMHIKGFSISLWNSLRTQAQKESRKSIGFKIIASDNRIEAIEAAKKNASAAGVDHLIEFVLCDYSETKIPEGGGIVILNPEYGERMGEIKELESVYKGIGDFFKQKCRGYTGYIFTGNLDLAKKIGLRAKRRIQFFNGPIDCRLLEYELYEGSRKNN
ncbi:MAG: class I SAM-dependent RNA methyltransferase [Nitrospiraceae bacterium]|nr:class I SAM-dependent RNA methyltransferase [Nitrospiraceae bacterium]